MLLHVLLLRWRHSHTARCAHLERGDGVVGSDHFHARVHLRDQLLYLHESAPAAARGGIRRMAARAAGWFVTA